MKRQTIFVPIVAAMFTAALAVNLARADIIAQWTFNTDPSDNAANTGTTIPETGAGSISLLGVNGTFAQGSGNDTSPTAIDNNNSSYNTFNYPPFESDNKTTGIQIAVNTTGYQDIILSFEHRHAPGASAAFQVQYSSDGVNYTDSLGYSTGVSNVFHVRTRDYGLVPELDNNPNARFRIVAEFMGMAYQGTSGTYMSSADSRFDLVTVSGTLVPEPTASALLLAIFGLPLLRPHRHPRCCRPLEHDQRARGHRGARS